MRRVRRHAPRLVLGSAATGAFLWLFLREVDLGRAWEQMRALPGWALLGASSLALVNLGFMALRWRYLLHGAGYDVPLRSLFSTVSVGRAANNVVPARGGDLLRIESMREIGNVPAFVTAGTLFAERLLDGVVFAAWIVVGALAVDHGGAMLLTGIALAAATAAGVVLVTLAARRPHAAERVARWVAGPLPPRWQSRVVRSGGNFVVGLGAFRERRRLAQVGAASAAMWLADVAMFALVGRAFALDLGLGAYFLLEGIGNLAFAVPATAAGLGTFDYLTYLAVRGVDVDAHAATAYVLTMHALVVVPVTVVGLLLVRPAFPRLFRGGATAREAS